MSSRKALVVLASLAAAMTASAQQSPQFPAPPQDDVLIIVWSDAKQCYILDFKTGCWRVPSLLGGRFQVGRDRNIVVATKGRDQEVLARAAQLMSEIRAAGYHRVRLAPN